MIIGLLLSPVILTVVLNIIWDIQDERMYKRKNMSKWDIIAYEQEQIQDYNTMTDELKYRRRNK